MANINSIAIQISADSAGAVSNINKVGTSLSRLGSQTNTIVGSMVTRWLSFAGVAAGIYSVVNAIKKYADMGEELLKTSQMLGISVEHLSGLKYAAELSETSIESLTTGVGIFSKSLSGINEEGKDTTYILKQLGVTSRDPYTALLQLADSFSKMQDSAAKTHIAMMLLGRSGKDLIPLMNEGTAGIKRMHEEAERVGIIMSTDAAKGADAFNDNITKLKANLQGLTYPILSDLIGKLNHFYETVSKKGIMGGLWSQAQQQQMQNNIEATDESINNYLDMIKDSAKGDIWWRKLLGLDVPREEIQKRLEDLYKYRDSLINAYNKKYGSMEIVEKPISKAPAPAFIDPEEIKKKAEAIQKLNIQIQDMIDKTTLSPAALIQKQADAWLKAGADKIKIQQWVNAEITKLNNAAWEANIKERLAYDEFMQKEADKELARQEELHNRVMEFYRQEAEFKVQMYEDSWRQIMDMANQVGGEAGQGIGQMMAGMKGITDIGMGVDPYSQRIDQLQEFIWRANEMQVAGKMSEIELEEYTQQRITEMDFLYSQRRQTIAQNLFGTMAGLMQSMYVLSGKKNAAMFRAYQVFAMAEAVVSTAAGVARALKEYSWPYSVIVGALVAAAGAIQIATIASATPGGGTAMSAPSGGGGYAYTSPTEPSWQAEEKPKSQIINVHVYGNVIDHDAFARELVLSISKAQADGAH